MSTVESANAEKVRHGKTEKDRKGGANGRRLSNQLQRATWSGEAKGSGNPRDYPTHTLGGKGNSSKAYKVVGGTRTKKYRKK